VTSFRFLPPLLSSPLPPGTFSSSLTGVLSGANIKGSGLTAICCYCTPKPEAYLLCHPICVQDQSRWYALPPAAHPRHVLRVGAGWREGGRAGVGGGVGRCTAAGCRLLRAGWWLTSQVPHPLHPSRYLSPCGRGGGDRQGAGAVAGHLTLSFTPPFMGREGGGSVIQEIF
jgi:hypothetical protein